MSGESAHTVGDGTESEDEIQPAVGEAILDIQASTSDVAETRVAGALENFLGVTEETQQLRIIVDAMRRTEEEHDTDENRRQTYKIQKVPEIMRRNKELEEYFKPRQLSIGPIHAADPNLVQEEFKLQLAAYFLNEIRKKRADSGLFTKFESRMHDIAINTFFEDEKHFFRKIRELQAAGINFKPTDSLRDISFHSQFSTTGQLVLPTLVVDNLTPCMLMNLVAYEMCLSNTQAYNSGDAVKKSWVTSYVNLLDLLIDDEQDVKDLRAAGILRNCLSSDSEVAQLINTVGSHCFAPPEDMYEHVKYQIGRHCRKRSAVWMSQVYRTHFSSPWSILALTAAIVVLGLTAAQTYYAVHPNS